MVKASESLEENSTKKEIIEADNKAEEMMKKDKMLINRHI
jgi:hypothetical protein